MLAFYGWTDLQLINHVHVKSIYYKDELADLYVLKIPRISKALLDTIKTSGIFTNIYELTPSSMSNNMCVAEKIIMLFSKKKYYSHYKKQLPTGKVYSEFFTGALWSDARYIIRLLQVKHVNFVEEGTATYDGIIKLQQSMPRAGFRERILRMFHFSKERYVLGKIYVYEPDICKNTGGLPILQLPIIKPGSIVHKLLVNTNGDITPYKIARHIYIASRGEVTPDNLPPDTLVQPHPADRPSLPMEWVYAQLDIREKILMTNSTSTAIITPRSMFGIVDTTICRI